MVDSAQHVGLFPLCSPLVLCDTSFRWGVMKEQGRKLNHLAKARSCAILNRLISPWSETKA